MKNNLEYRSFDLVDAKVDNEKRTITGRCLPYNSKSVELRTITGEKFIEIILPGALDESLKQNDILALAHHRNDLVLGRTSAGTLKLENREDGLYAEISVPDTSYGEDLLVSCMRGDIKGFSFGFNSPTARNYTREGMKYREISKLNLREVSVVANPAYKETNLALRNEDFAEETPAKVEEKAPETVPAKLDDSAYKLKQRFYETTHNQF